MKKLIYNSFLCMSISSIFLLTSCENNNENLFKYNDLGATITLENSSITNFDRNEDLDIKIITAPDVSVKEISIFKAKEKGEGEEKISDATITDQKATFNASVLAPYNKFGENKNEDYGSFDSIYIVSKLSNGKTIKTRHSIAVGKAISIENDIDNIEFKNPYTKPDSNGNTVKKEINYKVSTAKATIDKVTVEWKKNSDGTYVDTGDNYEETGVIDLKTLDYLNKYNLQSGDTLYYRVTAMKGDITESAETSVAIVSQVMKSSGSYTFSEMNNSFSFFGADTPAEVSYSASTLTSNGAIQFSKLNLTGNELVSYYNKGDLFMAKNDFDSSANTLSAITPLVSGGTYLYKIIRESVEYYGIFKITDVAVNNGHEKVTIEYKEGTILE